MSLIWSPDYAPVDGDFADVSLLLKGEGTNGSTTILDSSSNNLSVSANNGAQISTAQAKFGSSSIEILSGVTNGLVISPSVDFQFNTGDWTVEAWIYQRTLSLFATLFEIGNHTLNNSFAVFTGSDNSNGLTIYSGAYFYSPTRGTLSTNQWQFVTISKQGNFLYFSVNGIVDTPVSFTNNLTNTSTVSVGYSYGAVPSGSYGGTRFDGYISNLRITKGVARYTENFDVPTAPFPILSPSGRITIADDSLDADARQYIINVEEQDGEELEAGVRTAINNFVVGCKSDGIWNAIKASCLLCGARTLEGALVPLKGGAPTNFNFTSSDYDRELGLLGNGSTKYLDANRRDNADPQDNSHRSVYVSTAHTLPPLYGGYIGNAYTSPLRLSYILSAYDGNPLGRLITVERSSDGAQEFNTQAAATGFVGTSRDSSSQSKARAVGSTVSFNVTSSPTVSGGANYVFARNVNGSVDSRTNARIAFYSLGESLDLALLDTRISDFITAIGAAIP